MTPSLAAIVPATDGAPTLGRCLAALRGGSDLPDELLVEREPAGAGPAAARNAAAARASADVLVFVDADVAVDSEAVRLIRRAFAADRDLTALFGAYDDAPAARGAVSRFRNLLHHHVHTTAAGPAETFWAGIGAVRREAFVAAGGFDAERYASPSVEDIELGMRLRAAGARIVCDPAVRGTHLKRWSLGGMVRTDFARRGLPWTRLVLERRRGSRALNLSPRHRASAAAAVAAGAALAARRPRLAAAATGSLAALNAPFYALLARRGGPGLLAAGLPLHALHHLTAASAGVAGVVAHVASGRGRRGRESPAMRG